VAERPSDTSDDPRAELRAVVGQLRTNLERRARSGLARVSADLGARPAAERKPALARAAVAAPAAPRPVVQAPAVVAAGEAAPAPAPDKPRTGGAGLKLLRDDIGDCKRCKLAPSRTNLVYGVGNPDAELVFVGEAPGADEDAQGEPFVGKAGPAADQDDRGDGVFARRRLHLQRAQVPPAGQPQPEPDEVASCEPFLKRQLAAIRPRMIVALGSSRRSACCATTRRSRACAAASAATRASR
jgi:DNA polymerase